MKKDKETSNSNLPKRWVKCDIEVEYFGDDRKRDKLERKIAKAKDRSKYKKTDQQKIEKESARVEEQRLADSENLLRGRVISITPQGYSVDCEGEMVTCTLRGTLKKEKSLVKNLVTTGDYVRFEKTTENEGLIAFVEPEYPEILRHIADPPPVISVLGNRHLLQKHALAIVGARNASLNGRKFAEKLARELGDYGYQVVSGLARGIDTSVHVGS